MITQWNEDEDEALQELPHFAQLLYLRALRRHMDYRTGIVGITRKISYQMMREILTVKRRRGSTTRDDEHGITKKKLRVALEQLADAGLIEWVSRERFRDMVIRLPKASINRDFLNDPACLGEIHPHEEGHMKGMRAGACEGHGGNVVPMRPAGGYPQGGGAYEGHGRKGIHQGIRISTDSTTSGGNERQGSRARVDSLARERTPVPDDFAVTEQHVEYARAHRLPDPHECVLAFVAHHQARGTLRENWDAEFRKWLANERVYRRGGTRHAQADASGADRNPSRRQRTKAEVFWDSISPGLAVPWDEPDP